MAGCDERNSGLSVKGDKFQLVISRGAPNKCKALSYSEIAIDLWLIFIPCIVNTKWLHVLLIHLRMITKSHS